MQLTTTVKASLLQLSNCEDALVSAVRMHAPIHTQTNACAAALEDATNKQTSHRHIIGF